MSYEPGRHVLRLLGWPKLGAVAARPSPPSTRGSRSPRRGCSPSSCTEEALRSAEGGRQWTPVGSSGSPLGRVVPPRHGDPADTAAAGSSLGVCPAAGVLAQGHGLPGAPLMGDWARRGRMETWPR